MSLIENLKWRYATKKFDNTRKISPEDLVKLKGAITLSASSYGLQPYKVFIIENKELRQKLQPASWGQSQIVDASHLIVFAGLANVSEKEVRDYVTLKAKIHDIDAENLKGYGDFVIGKMKEKSSEEMKDWTARQTYIALGNLLAACAELKIDACPMEGFEPDKYDEILGLKERGLATSVIATIGYRSEEDQTQYAPKVRKPENLLFEVL